ncbi:MAG: autotransporter outer membrane beta-barrel domain-containing protein [Planctomycetaceae bacterium]|nr:autotransporter outer membrane beta-barrel domain-containing protein [Planctomycetaceae bacterium]
MTAKELKSRIFHDGGEFSGNPGCLVRKFIAVAIAVLVLTAASASVEAQPSSREGGDVWTTNNLDAKLDITDGNHWNTLDPSDPVVDGGGIVIANRHTLTIDGDNSSGDEKITQLDSVTGGLGSGESTMNLNLAPLDPAKPDPSLKIVNITVDKLNVERGTLTVDTIYANSVNFDTVAIGSEPKLIIRDNSRIGHIDAPWNTGSITIANGARLHLDGPKGWAPGYSQIGTFNLGRGTLVLGDLADTTETKDHNLYVKDWISDGGTVVFAACDNCWASFLRVDCSISGTTKVTLAGNADRNLIKLLRWGQFTIITAPGVPVDGTEFDLQDCVSSRYRFIGSYLGGGQWGYNATSSAKEVIADVAPIVEIFGLDLPMSLERNQNRSGQSQSGQSNQSSSELSRAQYADGPWARIKGGRINDDALAINKNTYQTLQVGWDKSFDAAFGGIWNAGAFIEGDWLYGRGDFRPWESGEVMGKLSSESRGTALGYYVSREFRNLAYIDFVGRTSWLDNKVVNTAFDGAANSYRADWKTQMFTLGLEFGKTFNSKNGRWIFNPYNRLLYNSDSGKGFDVNYGDETSVITNLDGYGVWTNRLGGRLTLNIFEKDDSSKSKKVSRRFFVQGDWYKGISGEYGASYFDPTTDSSGKINLGRDKNDMSYGVGTVGLTLYPFERAAFTVAGEGLFGDINGYGVTGTLKLMF